MPCVRSRCVWCNLCVRVYLDAAYSRSGDRRHHMFINICGTIFVDAHSARNRSHMSSLIISLRPDRNILRLYTEDGSLRFRQTRNRFDLIYLSTWSSCLNRNTAGTVDTELRVCCSYTGSSALCSVHVTISVSRIKVVGIHATNVYDAPHVALKTSIVTKDLSHC